VVDHGDHTTVVTYGLLHTHSLADAHAALDRFAVDDVRHRLAVAVIESTASIARSIAAQHTARAAQEVAKKRTAEAIADAEEAKRHRTECLAKIETTGRAAEVMNSNVGGMNAAARRILRSNLIRCIDQSVDTPLDDDRDLL
jgi:hypothetical protein